ncbi:Uncharacterised protein [Vibrio cholerae]|nr:Uncharacterised protein [Vibrio cholerae]CSI62540.1 Uncharacterised protein [Vibrio cholerae]
MAHVVCSVAKMRNWVKISTFTQLLRLFGLGFKRFLDLFRHLIDAIYYINQISSVGAR